MYQLSFGGQKAEWLQILYDHLTPATPLLKKHNEINETMAKDDHITNTQD